MLNRNNFGPDNRTKTIGNSMYRICNTKFDGSGEWYIHETFNDGKTWCQANAHYRSSLDDVLDVFNLLECEGQIISLKYYSVVKYTAPMSRDDAYSYYYECFQNGIYNLRQLKEKYRKGMQSKSEWESYAKKHDAGARDYESYSNMQRALRAAIKDIWQESFTFKPVPDDVSELDFEKEEKKISILNRILFCTIRKHPLGYSDDYYHNLRALLIARIEQASDYRLIVDFDHTNPYSAVKVRDRKEYLKERYGSCHGSLCLNCEEICSERITAHVR